ncbi:MAG: hypothetical protein KDE30_06740 [Novosphingobium sp.]|nr:hypothetical protein [Novosphingobium sp.]
MKKNAPPAQSTSHDLEEMRAALMNAEHAERTTRGLPGYHVLDLAEFPFAFALDERAKFEAAASTPLDRVMAALSRRDYDEANRLMGVYEREAPNVPQTKMRFGLAPEATAFALPKVQGGRPHGPSFFFVCDKNYFRLLCRPLLWSLAEHAPDLPVHLHIMDPDQDPTKLGLPLQITWSYEQSGELIMRHKFRPAFYYGAARFIRFAEFLEQCDGPLVIADVDSLATGDVKPLLASDSLAMRVRPGRLEPWNQYSACLVRGAKPSLPYFRRVADILRASMTQLWWGVDQYALFSAALASQPDITLIGPDLASVDANSPGLFWFTAGKAKTLLETSDSEYAKLFRRYQALNLRKSRA